MSYNMPIDPFAKRGTRLQFCKDYNTINVWYYREDNIEYQIVEEDGYWHLQAKRLLDGKYISLDTKFESFEKAEEGMLITKLMLTKETENV